MKLVSVGDNAHLALLFERYHLPLFRYLLHLSRDRALSEDLVQETFFRVLKYAGSYDPRLVFQVWLFTLARNAYFDTHRKKKVETAGPGTEEIRSPEPMPQFVLVRKHDVQF